MDQAFECYAQVLKVGDSFFFWTPDGWKAVKIQQSRVFSMLWKEDFLPRYIHVRDPAATYKQRIQFV